MSETNGTSRVVSILIVEDEPDTRDSLAMLLRMDGHLVRVAGNAHAALQLVDESVPEVVLIDIGLPGTNGYELARLLRSKQLEHRPLLIATTGFGDGKAKQNAFASGIDLHFVKPVDPTSLTTLLNHLSQLNQYVSLNGHGEKPEANCG